MCRPLYFTRMCVSTVHTCARARSRPSVYETIVDFVALAHLLFSPFLIASYRLSHNYYCRTQSFNWLTIAVRSDGGGIRLTAFIASRILKHVYEQNESGASKPASKRSLAERANRCVTVVLFVDIFINSVLCALIYVRSVSRVCVCVYDSSKWATVNSLLGADPILDLIGWIVHTIKKIDRLLLWWQYGSLRAHTIYSLHSSILCGCIMNGRKTSCARARSRSRTGHFKATSVHMCTVWHQMARIGKKECHRSINKVYRVSASRMRKFFLFRWPFLACAFCHNTNIEYYTHIRSGT